MKLVKIFGIAWILAVATAFAGTVTVSDSFVGSESRTEIVEPGQYKAVPVGKWAAGDELAVQINAGNKVFKDITACLVSEEEARSYRPGSQCRGYIKGVTPFAFKWQVDRDASYYLILDNSYAAIFKKTVAFDLRYKKILSAETASRLNGLFESIRAKVDGDFENADFNIYVKPCGQSNAFSDNRSADITICSEIIGDLGKSPGALLAVVLHEYGHSLLNRWGEPGASEEDMADQFATIMLLKAGDQGRAMLLQWIQYWMQRDSRAEAQNQLHYGDTHTLSIQRARNIQNAINFPEDLTRRWNKMLYRHMKKDALLRTINKPMRMDDLDLAKAALASK
jgi:hypothetical protein